MAMLGSKKFTWVIKNPSSELVMSDLFEIGGCKWYLFSVAKKSVPHTTIVLVLKECPPLPYGCSRHVKYRLTIVNQHSEELFVVEEGQYWFDLSAPCWIVSSTLPLSILHDRDGELTVNGDLKLVGELKVSEISQDSGEANDDAFEEGLDGNEKSEEGLDDDVWSLVSNVESVKETANNMLNEIQPVKETINVIGFVVSSSQVESVNHIFKRHPDIALGFRPKNQHIKNAYMNELLSLIEMLCQSPENLSEGDLSNVEVTLADLIDVGFQLDWLKTKLNEVREKKTKEQCSVAKIQTIKEQLQNLKMLFLVLETKLKQKCSELDTLMKKEEAELSDTRTPLSFDDVV